MNRIMRGAVLALIAGAVAAPAASADTGTGGTPMVPPASTTTSPAPIDGVPTTDPGAPTAVPPTRTVTLSRSQTKSVQRRIGVRADGALGSRTRTALRRYQKRHGLAATGRPNLQTLTALRLGFAATIERRLSSTAHASPGATAGTAAAAIEAAQSQIGTPYRTAGTAPGGFDCSGLTMWAFAQAGVTLPRTSFDQYEEGTAVARADIQPGDLVFFSTAGSGASHVGIATSATTVISATSSGVMEHHLDDDYWGAAYVGARRLAAA